MKANVKHALLALMVEQMYLTVPVNIAVSLLVGVVIASTFGTLNVVLWVALGILIGAGRVMLFKRIMPHYLSTHQYQRMTIIITLMLIIGGCHWGLAAWFFLDPQYPDIYLFVAIAILGMVSASLANLSALPTLWLVYAASVFTFVVAKMISLENWSVSIMSCIFIVGLWGLSRKLGEQISASITKDFQNAELLDELKIAKEAAERSSIEKSRFMAATSHDLRQPLHAQGLLLTALQSKLNTDDQQQLLSKITQSNNAVNSLFDSLLEISQLDANTIKVHRSHQSLKTICEEVVNEFESLANKQSLSIELLGDDYAVFTDPVLLKRIVRNLLSNALKNTHQGGVILQITQSEPYVCLSVIDTGIGIPKSEHESIFDEYVQLHNQARDRNKGVGLGLALVKRMCHLLELKIGLESTLGEGTRFSLQIPKGDLTEIIQLESEPNFFSVEGLTIFVIDNEEAILQSMRALELQWQCQFHLFISLEKAQQYIENDNNAICPDAIISDYRLAEDITGVDAIAKLREFYKSDVPALLISGDTDTKLLTEVQASGIYMLHKPIDAEKLKTAIAILANN